MPDFVLGMNCKLYRNTTSYASPTWAAIDIVRDLTLGMEKGQADVSTRGNNGWRANASTLKEGSIEFEIVWKPGDASLTALRSAFLNNTPLELLALDGPVGTLGSEGLRATCDIVSFGRNEPLEEGVTVSVVAKPTLSVNPPEWFTVTPP